MLKFMRQAAHANAAEQLSILKDFICWQIILITIRKYLNQSSQTIKKKKTSSIFVTLLLSKKRLNNYYFDFNMEGSRLIVIFSAFFVILAFNYNNVGALFLDNDGNQI